MKEQDNIEHLFKSTFDDFAVAPPASVKASVDRAIAARRKKKFIGWFSAGVIAFVLLFVAGISMLDNERHEQRLAQQETAASGQQPNTTGFSQNTSSGPAGPKSPAVSASDSSARQTQPSGEPSADHTGKASAGKDKPARTAHASESTSPNGSGKAPVKTRRAASRKAGKSSGSSRKASDRAVKRNKSNKRKASASGKQLADNPFKSTDMAGNGGPTKGLSATGNGAETANVNGNNPTNAVTPETKPKEGKTDPVAAQDTARVVPADSSVAEATPEPEIKKKALENSLLFSLRGGPEFGFNKVKNTDNVPKSLSEKGGFFIQAEATYLFGSKWGLTSGLNYDRRTENLSGAGYKDSIYHLYQTEYIYDTAQVIIDSIITVTDTSVLVPATMQNSYKLYAFSLPVMFAYSLELSPKLNLDLNAGALLSLQGSKVTSSGFDQGVTVNKFGVKACVRAQLRYQFSQWGVSLNTNFGYDLIPVNSWQGITRSRTYFNAGLGVHYLLSK